MRARVNAGCGPLSCERLRLLTLHAHEHPRGQPHLSAASGLVCAFGRVYVVADDEHHLGVFDDRRKPGELHRLLHGDLPRHAKKRKRRKADFETLVLLPAGTAGLAGERGATSALLTLGSGSTAQRESAVLQPLDAAGHFAGPARAFSVAPLHAALRAQWGAVNIEGAVVRGEDLLLLNRGGSGERGTNAVARFRLRDVMAAASAGASAAMPSLIEPISLHACTLGAVRGVGYGFTDATLLPDGTLLFTAVAEASNDSVADGECVGSALGQADANGELLWMRALQGAPKVEGIEAQVDADGSITVCLVTDADDPAVPSSLLLARL
jgi:hypothetical protein